MSSTAPSPKATKLGSGRLTGILLGFVVFVCISLIGLSGYVKYELDRAQTALTAPELELSPDLQSFDKIRRDLGYGGFVSLAQNFATTHEPAILSDMKAQLRQANERLEHMPEKSSAETRHDLQAVLATYDMAMQKAEKSTAVPLAGAPPGSDFTSADLAPLYAALPILDARIASAISANRETEQSEAQLWSTILTVISWSSLIIAAALATGISLVLRDRNSAPLRALAQSVKNMARGDMRTAIWGMERQDAVGELARSIDMARFHFSQLPDMSLLSEQGPVRIRFEGNTRSLFEAMMRVISRDSEQVHQQAAVLTDAVNKQQEALAHVISRVEAVLQNVESRAVSGDQQVRHALAGMLGSAESLKNAQEHAADQLNRIIPFLQERTQGMAEITQIAGKHVSQALLSLTSTERNLRSSAEQSEAAIKKFSTTADTLGERMFGAVNLLQASGKVLAETTETTQSRLEQAIERIGGVTLPSHNAPSESIAPAQASLDPQTAQRLEGSVAALEAAHAKLEHLLAEQTEATRAHIDLLTTQSGSLLAQSSTTSLTLSSAADRLREEQMKLGDLLAGLGGRMAAPAASAGDSNAAITLRIDELAKQISNATLALAGLPQQLSEQTQREPVFAAPLLADVKAGFESITHNINILHGQIATLQDKPNAGPLDNNEQMRDHWYQMAAQIEATRADLAKIIVQQTERVEAHLVKLTQGPADGFTDNGISRDTQSQMEQQTLILNELVATLSLLDAHMQELRSQVTEHQRAG